jgi:ligand-binding sensor domain-containing protein
MIIMMFCLTVTGQVSQEQHSFYSIKKQLSQSSISQILEDSQGFLWLATPNGIFKFDGTSLEHFDKKFNGSRGLTNNFITQIHESKNKTIFIGTYQGLHVYDPNLNIVHPFNFKNEGKIIQTRNIRSIEVMNDFLLLGTDNNGLYKYHLDSGKVNI